MRRRPLLPLLAGLLVILGAGPCRRPGMVTELYVHLRAQEYLRFATSEVAKGSILNAIAHMERPRRDPAYLPPRGAVDVDDWASTWDRLDHLRDTRDFDGLYLLNALLGYEGHTYLTPALWDRIRRALLSFKMWYVDPTPPQPDPAEPDRDWDNSYYWTENHQILYHTIEYLAGARFPDECFWIVGFERTQDCTGPGEMRGAAHRDRAHAWIERWLDERWEGGFAEFHSGVYLQKDFTPLLTLVEFAPDPEIAERAAIVLDVALLDLATHSYRGQVAAAQGRTYMKDKRRGPANDTWGIGLLLFGQQDEVGYQSTGDAATLFARAASYRLPQVLLEAALSQEVFAERTRQSWPIDEKGPVAPNPPFPPGHSYDDTEANFTFWWGLGAYTVWQIIPITVANGELYNLWNTDFLRPFKVLRDLLGEPPDPARGQQFAVSLWEMAALGLLSEVNTYTWRTPDYALGTAQDYRKGANAAQVQSWQATFGPETLVFTTHPMNAVQPPSEWLNRDEGEPGYWTGTASLPRSAQHENVGIHLYSPAYPDGGLLGFFDYQTFTHAYFPQDQFDEVVQDGHWVFGRQGDGYVALWSWRATAWQDYSAEELALLPPSPRGPITRSFDLVAPGGASNVWIVECGRAADWGSFEAFRAALLAAPIAVTDFPSGVRGVRAFDVAYQSPSQGEMRFGSNAPFAVDGAEVPLAGYPRVENPWVRAERGDTRWTVQGETGRLVLDWAAGTREAEVFED